MSSKLSKTMTAAIANLRSFGEEALKDHGPVVEINVNEEQLVKLTQDYSTTLSNGDERGVTIGDLEAVGNFHRDIHSAARLMTAEHGYPYLENNAEESNFKMHLSLPETAGFGTSVVSAVYRPGEEETNSQDYSSITRSWTSTADDKEIDDMISAMGSKLRKK